MEKILAAAAVQVVIALARLLLLALHLPSRWALAALALLVQQTVVQMEVIA